MGVGGREGYKWEPAGLSEAVTAPTSHLLILSSSSSISSEVGWHIDILTPPHMAAFTVSLSEIQ